MAAAKSFQSRKNCTVSTFTGDSLVNLRFVTVPPGQRSATVKTLKVRGGEKG